MKRILLFMLCIGLNAMDGSLDPSFGGGTGFIDTPLGFALVTSIQTDGKILVMGSNSVGITIVVRYNSNGTLDTSFGTNGIVTDTTGMFGSDMLLQPDGKIIVGGSDASFQNFQLNRYNSNGTIDTTFGSQGITIGPVGDGFALALQTDSKIILAGTDNNTALFKVVRYTANGSIDTVFQSGPREFATGIMIQNDGKIVVAGNSDGTATFHLVIVRYNTDGTLDNSFVAGAAPLGVWGPIVLQPDGKIIAAGNTFTPTVKLARFNTNGSLDTSFGGGVITGPPGIANSLLLQADGKSVIVGAPSFFGPTFQLVRYTKTGTIDTSFGTNGIVQAPSGVTAFGSALQSDGKIIAVGADITFTVMQVARYLSKPPLTPTTIETVTPTSNGILLSGTAQNPSFIYIFLNGVLLGGTTTDPKGTNTWSFNGPSQLGTYTVVAYYPDGNLDTAANSNGLALCERMWLC